MGDVGTLAAMDAFAGGARRRPARLPPPPPFVPPPPPQRHDHYYVRRKSPIPRHAGNLTLFARNNVAPESCFFKQCLGCRPEDIFSPGTPIECHPSNWVSPEWIYNHGHPPPSTASRVPIEYRCLKFVATPDDKSFGNTVDILKGCVPKQQADSVCVGLESVERARGHSDARCYICNRNNCNSAGHLHVTLTVPLISVILYYVFR